MLARSRQRYILDRVKEAQGVLVADLVKELKVSDMTVRRDFAVLQKQGLIERVYGGAILRPQGDELVERFQELRARYDDLELDRIREFLAEAYRLLHDRATGPSIARAGVGDQDWDRLHHPGPTHGRADLVVRAREATVTTR